MQLTIAASSFMQLPDIGYQRAQRWTNGTLLSEPPFGAVLRSQSCSERTSRDRPYMRCGWQQAFLCVSNTSVVAFVHVYKNAGTTVFRTMDAWCANDPRRTAFIVGNSNPSASRLNRAVWLPLGLRSAESLSLAHFVQVARHRVACGGARCTAPHPPYDPPAPLFLFTVVRDPIERSISAYHELVWRGSHDRKVHPRGFNGSFESFGSSFNESGGFFWNEHTYPQWLMLVDRDGPLPLSYIVELRDLDGVLGALFPQESQETPASKSPAIIPHIDGPSDHSSSDDAAVVVLRDELVRRLCRLFAGDYLAFSLELPAVCRAEADGAFRHLWSG